MVTAMKTWIRSARRISRVAAVAAAATALSVSAALAQEPGYVVFPMTADGKVHAVLAIAMSKRVEQRSGSDSGSSGSASGSVSGSGSRAAYDLLLDVEMDVTAELGRTRMTVRSLLDLEPGAIVELDRMAGSPVDLLVNGRLIARGEVVVVDEEFALRVTEIVASAVEAER